MKINLRLKKPEYQNIQSFTCVIQRRFINNPNSSISAIYRKLRNDPRLSLFGDYLVIAHILNSLRKIGITPKRTQVSYALRSSEELKGSRTIMNALFDGTCCVIENKNDSQANKNSFRLLKDVGGDYS